MIKKNSDISAVEIDNESERVFTPNNNETHNSPVTMNRSSGWSGMKSKLASLEAAQIIFREGLIREINELSSKITNLMKIVEEQREEIKTVKVENELQREEINAIKSKLKINNCAVSMPRFPRISHSIQKERKESNKNILPLNQVLLTVTL
jgi:hypothetical protein